MNPNTNEPESTLPVPPAPPMPSTVLIRAIVVLAVVTVAAMVATAVLLPDNPALGERIVLYAGGITSALMVLLRSAQNAAGIQKVHVDLNSRLTAFMKMQGDAERAKGVLEGSEAAVGTQHDTVLAAATEAATVARVAAETATAAAHQVAKVATEAAAALVLSAQAQEHLPDGTVIVTAPAVIRVQAPHE